MTPRAAAATVVPCLAVVAACAREPAPRPAAVLATLEEPARPGTAHTSGPLRVLAANPRFFADASGQAVWLAGAHTWNNFQDWGRGDPPPALDYGEYLAFLRASGHNFTRLWTWEQAAGVAWDAGPIRIQPLPYARTGPGLALDGRPRFDLHRFDQAYFDRLRERVRAAGEAGIYVSVMLFNGWSVTDKKRPEGGRPWRGHPFHRDNNVSGIDGDPNHDENGTEIQTLLLPQVTGLQKAYVAKVADTLEGCDNVIWEIDNEGEVSSRDWQYEMVRFLRSREGAGSDARPVGLTVAYPEGVNADLLASSADWISPRAGGEEPDALVQSALGTKVIINDTDHIWGIGGSTTWVWRTLLGGMNALFMDPYKSPVRDNEPILAGLLDTSEYRAVPPRIEWEGVRANLGFARAMARRCELGGMAPADHLVSAGAWCLARPGHEYLIYVRARRGVRRLQAHHLPGLLRSEVSIDLSGPAAIYAIEWLDPRTGELHQRGRVAGGGDVKLSPPFAGDAVLHLDATPTPDRARVATW